MDEKQTRLSNRRILAVDDDEAIICIMKSLYPEDGVLDTASNGMEALEKLAGNLYGVVVSDVNMPVMDGISFYENAVARYPRLKGRIIFFTSSVYGNEGFIRKNGIRCISKPCALNDIKKAVDEVLSS